MLHHFCDRQFAFVQNATESPGKLKRGAGMTLNMALELRTDCFCIGCDGLRPLLREGIYCTC